MDSCRISPGPSGNPANRSACAEAASRAILKRIDRLCEEHLDREYQALCHDLVAVIASIDPAISIERGRPEAWAAGIVHAIGWVNFLTDPANFPYMTNHSIAGAMGVSTSIMLLRSRQIRERLSMSRLSPTWCLPSQRNENPMLWLVNVNGVAMDMRLAPRALQAEAYRSGAIPFLPRAAEVERAQRSAPMIRSSVPSPAGSVQSFIEGIKGAQGEREGRSPSVVGRIGRAARGSNGP